MVPDKAVGSTKCHQREWRRLHLSCNAKLISNSDLNGGITIRVSHRFLQTSCSEHNVNRVCKQNRTPKIKAFYQSHQSICLPPPPSISYRSSDRVLMTTCTVSCCLVKTSSFGRGMCSTNSPAPASVLVAGVQSYRILSLAHRVSSLSADMMRWSAVYCLLKKNARQTVPVCCCR
jgi:hypothetical protein